MLSCRIKDLYFCPRGQNLVLVRIFYGQGSFNSTMPSLCFGEEQWADYDQASCILSIYIAPSICILGFLLNVSCICIFCTLPARQRSSLVPYLIALCTFDATQLLLSIFVLVLPAANVYFEDLHHTSIRTVILMRQIIVYSVGTLYPFLLTANYGSIWTMTLISVQRYKAICRPLHHIRTCDKLSARKTNTAVCTIALVAFLINFIRFWENDWVTEIWNENGSNITEIINLMPSELSKDYYYQLFDKIIYTLVIYVIPLTLVTFLNSRVVFTIYRARRMLRYGDRQTSSRQQREHRSAIMIITVILLFFLCHTGGLVVRFMSEDWIIKHEFEYLFLRDFSNILFNVNSFANPMIYFLFTRQFRDLTTHFRRGSSGSNLHTTSAASSNRVTRRLLNAASRTESFNWPKDANGLKAATPLMRKPNEMLSARPSMLLSAKTSVEDEREERKRSLSMTVVRKHPLADEYC